MLLGNCRYLQFTMLLDIYCYQLLSTKVLPFLVHVVAADFATFKTPHFVRGFSFAKSQLLIRASHQTTLPSKSLHFVRLFSSTPLLLLFRKKSRSACLFACKRAHRGKLSLPTFCDDEVPPKYWTKVDLILRGTFYEKTFIRI